MTDSRDKTTSDREVLNCAASGQVQFSYECPRRWEDMTPTGDPNRRRCDGCERDVFWCHNVIDAGLRADQGECIAVPSWLAAGVREEERRRQGVIICGISLAPSAKLKKVVEQRVARRREASPQND